MKIGSHTITLGAAVIAIIASFLAVAYVAGRYLATPTGTFAAGDAVAAPAVVSASKPA
jgi:hypothetical protein